MIKHSIIFIMLLNVSSAVAGSCGSTSCTGKLTNIYVHGATEKVYLEIEGDVSVLNCTLNQGKYIVLKDSNPRFSEIYSMLLSSGIAGMDVVLRIAENSSDCELVYTMLPM